MSESESTPRPSRPTQAEPRALRRRRRGGRRGRRRGDGLRLVGRGPCAASAGAGRPRRHLGDRPEQTATTDRGRHRGARCDQKTRATADVRTRPAIDAALHEGLDPSGNGLDHDDRSGGVRAVPVRGSDHGRLRSAGPRRVTAASAPSTRPPPTVGAGEGPSDVAGDSTLSAGRSPARPRMRTSDISDPRRACTLPPGCTSRTTATTSRVISTSRLWGRQLAESPCRAARRRRFPSCCVTAADDRAVAPGGGRRPRGRRLVDRPSARPSAPAYGDDVELITRSLDPGGDLADARRPGVQPVLRGSPDPATTAIDITQVRSAVPGLHCGPPRRRVGGREGLGRPARRGGAVPRSRARGPGSGRVDLPAPVATLLDLARVTDFVYVEELQAPLR